MNVFIKRAGPFEREALEHFGDEVSVKVLGCADGDLSLERIHPGTRLADLRDDDVATAHLCGVATRLHGRGMPDAPFPTVEEWGRGFARHRGRVTHIDRAAEMYMELAASQTSRCLLHGDLHQANILLDHERGWIAIDPKGVIGEPAYEFGAALRQETARQRRRTEIIVERTGLDRKRILGWAYAQAVLAAMWCIEDGADPTWAMAAADELLIQTRR